MIVTCPKYEYNPKDPSAKSAQILSPLAGQAVVKNLMPGRWGVIATPAADRIARGEEWHQTNTLDGQKAHDSFVRIGEPEYFQEYGPANFHVTIGFANPAIINSRKAGVCAGTDPNLSLPSGSVCNNSVSGIVTTERMSRTPDERLYSSGSHDSFYWTQCYVSFGDPDGEDFAYLPSAVTPTAPGSLTGLPPEARGASPCSISGTTCWLTVSRPRSRSAGRRRPRAERPRRATSTWARLPAISGRRTSTPGPVSTPMPTAFASRRTTAFPSTK